MTDDSVFGTDDAMPDNQSGTTPATTGSGSQDSGTGDGGSAPGAGTTETGGTTASGSTGSGSSSGGSASPSAGSSSGSTGGSSSGSGSGGSSPSGALPATTSSGPGVNSQILDAVKQSNSTVLGSAGNNGAAIAYQKVAQAASFAVQDSTDYLRNIMAMSSAATGVALKKMVENPATAAQYTPVLTAAQDAVTAAQENFAAVGSAAGTVVSGFPSGS